MLPTVPPDKKILKKEGMIDMIPEELMDDREMLQDMLLIAFNNAVSKCDEDRENQLGGLTAGLNLPGM